VVTRVSSLIALMLGGCSEGDYTLTRHGGPFPTSPEQDPPLDGGSGDAGAPAGSGGESGAGGNASGGAGGAAAEVTFCEALSVIRDRCQRCHTDPPENGAPRPFLTYEDTQATYPNSDQQWWQKMLEAVSSDFMPLTQLNDPPFNIMPPVEPLAPDQKATLLGWLEAGAEPTGGTECPEAEGP
jgi:hypothetical protein